MFHFSDLLRKNRFIGIDFGTSAIKVVELSLKNQQACLENYGWVEFDVVSKGKPNLGLIPKVYNQKLKICLEELLKKLELKSKKAYISMPGFTGLITLIDFPEMEKEELKKAIQFEAHKYIPTPLNEVALSWDIVARENEKGINNFYGAKKDFSAKNQILLVAALKRDVERYEKLVKDSGLDICAIELETFALVRSLVGNDSGGFLIIDIGSKATSIILVEKGIVKVNRNVDAGGDEITNTVSENMNISKQRAEALKKDGRDILNSQESSIVVPALEFIASEALRVLNIHKEKNKDAKIDTAILSGGSSKMTGIEQYLTKALGIQTVVGNPWKRIVFNQDLSPVINKMGASFSVAVGLALRGIEDYRRS